MNCCEILSFFFSLLCNVFLEDIFNLDCSSVCIFVLWIVLRLSFVFFFGPLYIRNFLWDYGLFFLSFVDFFYETNLDFFCLNLVCDGFL
ncbi:hypothetical protein IC575_002600 [Cucumis melo]